MKQALTLRATRRLAMLPLATLAFAAAPAAASEGMSASPAIFTLALTPAAVVTTTAKDGHTSASKAIKGGLRLGAMPCSAVEPIAVAPAPSKATIILKGAPSKLELMRLAQNGQPAPAASAPVERFSLVAASPGAAYPAAQTPTSALVAMPMPRACPAALSAIKNAMRPAATMPRAGVGTALLPPDPAAEFGSRALRINHTRFDDDWARVTRDPQRALMSAELAKAGIRAAGDEQALFQKVNVWANRQIGYASDVANYGRADHWATPAETLARGRGDCEDFAILKMQMLRAAGFDTERMKLVLLRDLVGGGDHAVLLVVARNGQRLVLDNTTDSVYDGSSGEYFRPILSYGSGGRFIHAFDTRRTMAAAPASLTPASTAPTRLALNDQRSVKADPVIFKTGFKR